MEGAEDLQAKLLSFIDSLSQEFIWLQDAHLWREAERLTAKQNRSGVDDAAQRSGWLRLHGPNPSQEEPRIASIPARTI